MHEDGYKDLKKEGGTVRRLCCGVISRGIYRSGGGIGKMDWLCVWVEMWE